MTAATATALAALLDQEFEQIADAYAAAIENGGGLEDVIAELQEIAKVAAA